MEEQNPFNSLPATHRSQYQDNALVDVEQHRAIAEVQSAMTIAKRFPRNQVEAMDRILQACARPTLAESAVYTYAKGGTDIQGPSIRLAEALAQSWGNLQFGIRELSQSNGESTVESYAWDIETNTRQVKTFQVPHTRYSRSKGNVRITDPREIYELIANQGARRLRACILGIIPGDVVEAAVKQCEATMAIKAEVTPERIQSLVEKFGQYQVTRPMIEARIQRRIDAMTPALMVQLGKIYNSLKDGMSSPADWFQADPGVAPETLKDKLKAKAADHGPKMPGPEPPTTSIPEPKPFTSEGSGEKPTAQQQSVAEILFPDVKNIYVDPPNPASPDSVIAPASTPTPQVPPSDATAWDDFRNKFINLKGAGFSTFVHTHLTNFKNCPMPIKMEAIAKWDKLYPNTLFPLNKPPVTPNAIDQPVAPPHSLQSDITDAGGADTAPVSYSKEYKTLMYLKNQFPEHYIQAKQELDIQPDTTSNCLTLLAMVNRKVDEANAEPKNEQPYEPPPISDTSGF